MSDFIPYDELTPEQKAQVDSEDWQVRIVMAHQGYGLDRLIDDKEWNVRLEVLQQGYGLERLADDPIQWIAMMAQKRLDDLEG